MKQNDRSGMLLVLRNNWPFYMAAAGVALIGLWAVIRLDLQGPLKEFLLAGAIGAIYWAAASLAASCWIYDQSGLYRMNWLQPHLPQPPCRALNLHAGLDLTSQPLRRLRPQDFLLSADIYDPASMTEGSIRRARRIGDSPHSNGDCPPLIRLQSDRMPFGDASFEIVTAQPWHWPPAWLAFGSIASSPSFSTTTDAFGGAIACTPWSMWPSPCCGAT